MDPSLSTTPDINRGPQILIVCGTLTGLAVLFVLARLWVRVGIIHQTGWDDYVIAAAAIVQLVEMIIIGFEVQHGGGRHAQYIVPASDIVRGLHMNFATQPLCLLSMCLTKISVGLFLLRLTPSLPYRRFIWFMIAFTALSTAGNLFVVFLQCTPLEHIWDPATPGRCISPANLKFSAFFNSAVATLTDIAFALLPVPMLWNIQLNWRVKTAVTGILSLGLFACAAAIIRMQFISTYGSRGDFLWDSTDITIWVTVEVCTATIAASIPSLKPLFKAVLGGTSLRHQSSKYHGSGRSGANGYIVPSVTSDNAVFEMLSRPCRPSKAIVRAGTFGNNDSEESMLSPRGGITRTTEVTVFVS